MDYIKRKISAYFVILVVYGLALSSVSHSYAPTQYLNNNDITKGYSQKRDTLRYLSRPNPVIFIPGDGGSQLEAKLNKTYRIHYICDQVSDWYDIWLNIHLLAPYAFDCLSDNLRLVYNKTSRTTRNTEGVLIRPTNFGSIDSVDYLDIYKLPKTSYFATIIEGLEKRSGLVRNVDMVGAAFDFRKGPNELGEFFSNLTSLIQQQYVMNNYRPVTLICHSMGCLNSVLLLNNQTQNWKDVYIKRLIALAAPWDGSVKAIGAMLYGDNLGIPLLNQNKLQSLQSTFPSLMYLFPRNPTFNNSRVLVSTKYKNYSLDNLDELFADAGLMDQMEMWYDTKSFAASLKAPNVELWCLYGSGIETPGKIVFKDTFAANTYIEIESDGDGTVNIESLMACEQFQSEQKQPVYTRMFPSVDHIDILRGNEATDFIVSEIMRNDIE